MRSERVKELVVKKLALQRWTFFLQVFRIRSILYRYARVLITRPNYYVVTRNVFRRHLGLALTFATSPERRWSRNSFSKSVRAGLAVSSRPNLKQIIFEAYKMIVLKNDIFHQMPPEGTKSP